MHSCVGENLGHPESMYSFTNYIVTHGERYFLTSELPIRAWNIYANGSISSKGERRDEKRVTFQ